MKSENFSQCERKSAHNVGNKSKRRRLICNKFRTLLNLVSSLKAGEAGLVFRMLLDILEGQALPTSDREQTFAQRFGDV